jgi:hypothetical protein
MTMQCQWFDERKVQDQGPKGWNKCLQLLLFLGFAVGGGNVLGEYELKETLVALQV